MLSKERNRARINGSKKVTGFRSSYSSGGRKKESKKTTECTNDLRNLANLRNLCQKKIDGRSGTPVLAGMAVT